jgi:predicted homoserine dehydrogenase-like protein
MNDRGPSGTSVAERLARRAAGGDPLRIALIGAGKFGTMILSQLRRLPGVELAVLADLDAGRAVAAAERAGWERGRFVATDRAGAVNDVVRGGRTAVVTDGEVAASAAVDLVIEATGNVEAGALHAYRAIQASHDVVMVTVEADVVVGPLLQRMAAHNGVVYSMAYGDQPALICELVDWAKTCGFEIVAAGKGTKFLPAYRRSTPDDWYVHYGFTPEEVERGGLNGRMFNSFLDGTKSAIEMVAVANATGLDVSDRGLSFAPVEPEQLARTLIPAAAGGILSSSGMLDVVTCVRDDGTFLPNHLRWGVYVTFTTDDLYTRQCWHEYGISTDPSGVYAAFWRPYHFIGLEIGVSIGSVALDRRPTGAPFAGPRGEVVCASRTPLRAGQTIAGEGGYAVYGLSVSADLARRDALVPLGLATGLRLKRDLGADHLIGYGDLEAPEESAFAWKLRREQERTFEPPKSLA